MSGTSPPPSVASVLPLTPRAAREWPGRARREPRLGDRSYLVHAWLARLIKDALDGRAEAAGGLGTVIDVGCGERPYFPWIAGRCKRYVGVDLGPAADVQGTVEALPLPDECADLVLCTQVLEHVQEPARAVEELGRVLRPGGVALVSTHGVQPYHPTPVDYWRWTGAGLRKLFEDCGRFSRLEVQACGGTVACLFYLASLYASIVRGRAARRGGARGLLLRPLADALVPALNACGRAGDRRVSGGRDFTRANSLTSNFLVVAER